MPRFFCAYSFCRLVMASLIWVVPIVSKISLNCSSVRGFTLTKRRASIVPSICSIREVSIIFLPSVYRFHLITLRLYECLWIVLTLFESSLKPLDVCTEAEQELPRHLPANWLWSMALKGRWIHL